MSALVSSSGLEVLVRSQIVDRPVTTTSAGAEALARVQIEETPFHLSSTGLEVLASIHAPPSGDPVFSATSVGLEILSKMWTEDIGFHLSSVGLETLVTRTNAEPRVGTNLKCSLGTWRNQPMQYVIQWYRHESLEEPGTPIEGANGIYYMPTEPDIGKYFTVTVQATNEFGNSEPAISDSFGPILPEFGI